MRTPCPANEASSSAELSNLTGGSIRHLNKHAPVGRMLRGFEWILNSANPRISKTASQALLLLLKARFSAVCEGCTDSQMGESDWKGRSW
jgi:hypothetical protein